MFREAEGGYNTPSLVSGGLQERPVKNSMQKIQDTLTSWGRNTWKCRSAGVLSQEEGVHLFDSTSSDLLSTQESKETEFLLGRHREREQSTETHSKRAGWQCAVND